MTHGAPAALRGHRLNGPLQPEDRAAWERLARAYHAFYGESFAEQAYDATWSNLASGRGVFGAGAYVDGRLAGIVHFLFHGHVWDEPVCYLQDLFVDEMLRGRGIGRSLIDYVAAAARQRGSSRLYWLTKEDNAVARRLYDSVAAFRGFIRYEIAL